MKRVPVPRVAASPCPRAGSRISRQRLGMKDELAAFRRRHGRDKAGFDAELVRLAGLAIRERLPLTINVRSADAFHFGRVQRVNLGRLLPPALRCNARSHGCSLQNGRA